MNAVTNQKLNKQDYTMDAIAARIYRIFGVDPGAGALAKINIRGASVNYSGSASLVIEQPYGSIEISKSIYRPDGFNGKGGVNGKIEEKTNKIKITQNLYEDIQNIQPFGSYYEEWDEDCFTYSMTNGGLFRCGIGCDRSNWFFDHAGHALGSEECLVARKKVLSKKLSVNELLHGYMHMSEDIKTIEDLSKYKAGLSYNESIYMHSVKPVF